MHHPQDPPPLLNRLDSNAMESLKNYSLGNRKLSIDVTSIISEGIFFKRLCFRFRIDPNIKGYSCQSMHCPGKSFREAINIRATKGPIVLLIWSEIFRQYCYIRRVIMLSFVPKCPNQVP